MRSVDWCDVARAVRVGINDGKAELLTDGATSVCHVDVACHFLPDTRPQSRAAHSEIIDRLIECGVSFRAPSPGT